MNKLQTIFMGVGFLFFGQCTSLEFGSVLPASSEGANCKTQSLHQYHVLYGLIPLNHIELAETISGYKNYRIVQKPEILDILVSVIGGVSISVSRRTLTIELCEPTQTAKIEEKNAEVEQASELKKEN